MQTSSVLENTISVEERQLFTEEEENIVMEFLNSCKQDLAVKRDVKNSCKYPAVSDGNMNSFKHGSVVKRDEQGRSKQNKVNFSGRYKINNVDAFVNNSNNKISNESDC